MVITGQGTHQGDPFGPGEERIGDLSSTEDTKQLTDENGILQD